MGVLLLTWQEIVRRSMEARQVLPMPYAQRRDHFTARFLRIIGILCIMSGAIHAAQAGLVIYLQYSDTTLRLGGSLGSALTMSLLRIAAAGALCLGGVLVMTGGRRWVL